MWLCEELPASKVTFCSDQLDILLVNITAYHMKTNTTDKPKINTNFGSITYQDAFQCL